MKRISVSLLAGASACLMLSACGGGGGGVNSTPTPTPTPTPPPAPTNTSLLGTLVSESFTNDAATGSASFPKNGNAPTTSQSAANVSVRYDAGSQAYTITNGSRSQTFRPADIDAANTDEFLKSYVRKSGSTTDSLALTKPGTSGAINYEYAGAGYWQRTSEGSSTITGSVDAFVYGIETLDSALPRTGSASYGIALIGVGTYSDNIYGISGAGTLHTDFASGAVVVRGIVNDPTAPASTHNKFWGSARISSNANAFSGEFRLDDFGEFRGQMNGRFFGPDAQEVGAAWSAAESSGRIATGTIIGRKEGDGVNLNFDQLQHSAFFHNDAAIMKASYTGSVISGQTAARTGLIINYDAESGRYTLITNDAPTYYGDGSYGSGQAETLPATSSPGHYVRGALLDRVVGSGNTSNYNLSGHAYGLSTPDAAIPRVGEGNYPVSLVAAVTDSRQNSPISVRGEGVLRADFATGSVSTSGSVQAYFDYTSAGAVMPVDGLFSGNANLASNTNNFAGNFTLDVLGKHEGAWAGRFYGPAAQEVGAAFSGTDEQGNVTAGVIVGATNDAIVNSFKTLAQLDRNSKFPGNTSDLDYYFSPQANGYINGSSTLGSPDANTPFLIYDPNDTNRLLSFETSLAHMVHFGQADLVAAESVGMFDVYKKTDVDKAFVARVYRPNAAASSVALTYTSFVELHVTRPRGSPSTGPNDYYDSLFTPFGSMTSRDLMPRSGTASYSGIVSGRGLVGAMSTIYDLTGTSTLNVDFGAHTARTSIAIQGTDLGGGQIRDFGNFGFFGYTGIFDTSGNGQSTAAGFVGSSATTSNLRGFFFGPHAEEFAAVFSVNTFTGGEYIRLSGVTVGKKD